MPRIMGQLSDRRGASARYFDEIVALIRGGMSGAEACAAKPEYPKYRSLTEWATKHGRKDEISACFRRGCSARHFDEIVALIRGGLTGLEACAAKPEYPNYRTLTEWAVAHGRKDEISAAWHDRERSPTAARFKNNLQFTEEHWDQVLERIRAKPKQSIRRILRNAPAGLPGRTHIYQRAKECPVFADRLAAAKESRTAYMKIPNRPAPRRFEQDVLRRQLFDNELFRVANSAVPRKFQQQDRDDFIAEIIIDLIEGKCSLDEFRLRGRLLFSERLQKRKTSRLVFNLDETVYSDNEQKKRVDLLTANEVLAW